HRTAGTNSYTLAEAPAIVRGIEVYHVKGNGWNDIGYNFLIDRYGTVYEGRGGGMTRNVIGAHALGFNTGTVGVSMIGNFAVATPPPAMQAALVSLLAWRLDVAHIDPLSTVAYTSGGNGKFRAGKVVTLRAISGHRAARRLELELGWGGQRPVRLDDRVGHGRPAGGRDARREAACACAGTRSGAAPREPDQRPDCEPERPHAQRRRDRARDRDRL